MTEAVHALLKAELYRNPPCSPASGATGRGLDDLEVETCGWVSWFNTERLHSELGDLTPAETEQAYTLPILRPSRPENPNRKSLHQTQAEPLRPRPAGWQNQRWSPPRRRDLPTLEVIVRESPAQRRKTSHPELRLALIDPNARVDP
ncbi:MAG: transposase [Acidimicrobiaceae bacterium]|nr:transposase [Acidimicrobiaceae bacterium]